MAEPVVDEELVGAGTYAERLERATDVCEELREQLELAYRHRDEIIVEAHDEGGLAAGHIGRHARMSRQRVNAILAEH